jgi:TolB-like protein
MKIPVATIKKALKSVSTYSSLPLAPTFVVALHLLFLVAGPVRAQDLAFSRAAEDAASRLSEAFPPVRGSVVGLEGDRILIDLGGRQKIQQGMELQLYREGEEVKHPVSGQVLGRRDKRLGLLRVVEVKEGFSEGVVVSRHEGSTITIGDLVRVSPDRLSIALPLIDAGEVKGADVYALTKDLAISLTKTGRFIVIEDHLIRAALMGDRPPRLEAYTEPAILKALAEKAHAQLLVLGRLSPADRGVSLNMQLVSVSSGAPLTVASVEVPGVQARMMATTSAPAPGQALRPGSGQASSETARPSFVRAQPQAPELPRASDEPRSPSPGGAVLQKPLAAEVQRKEGTPSFLIKGEDKPGQPGDQTSKDHVTFELAEPLLQVAAGHLDADRRPAVVGITSSEVIVYRWQEKKLVPIARAETDPFVRNLHLDVGDVNGSGQAQVFVTAMSSVPEVLTVRNSLRSYVLELRGGKLVRIADGLGYFLRVLTGPGLSTPMLIAQRIGQYVPFEGPITRLEWSGEQYVQGPPLSLPAPVKGLYEFALLEAAGDQVVEMAVVNEQKQMTIYGRGGQTIWEARDDLGEVDHLAFFQTPQAPKFNQGIRAGVPPNPEDLADRIALPRRILIEAAPLWGDAKVELLTIANSMKYGFQVRLGGDQPASGRIVAYDRHDGMFSRGWETVPVEGQVRDIALVDLGAVGRKDLLVLSAVKEKGFVASLKDKARGYLNVFSFSAGTGG